MAELVIKIHKYIGESSFNWETGEFEWATSAEDVRMAVEYAGYAGQTVDSICFEIGTCFGGSTFDGTEIYNYVQGLGIPIRTRILSFAASMATILMLAGEECEIDASASIMVHAPSMETRGTAAQIGANLKGLNDAQLALRDIYVARTGQTVEVVEGWISKDTFFTAAEALAVGLVTKVIPIAPKTAPALTDAQASARRAKYAGIVARAEKHQLLARQAPKPKSTSAATTASTPRPMAKKVIPISAAAKAAAAKPTALNANQKAVAAFAKQMGVAIKMEGEPAADTNEPTAEVVATVLADGAGTLYTDGELAQGSEVFNDEALTTATADGVYETEDARDVTVAGGVVESIANTEASTENGAAPTALAATITAAVTAALGPVNQELTDLRAMFGKAVPPLPRARGVVQGTDGKAPKPKAAHHAGL